MLKYFMFCTILSTFPRIIIILDDEIKMILLSTYIAFLMLVPKVGFRFKIIFLSIKNNFESQGSVSEKGLAWT